MPSLHGRHMVGDEPETTLVVAGLRLKVGDIAVRKRHKPVAVLEVESLTDAWLPQPCQVVRVRPARPWEMLSQLAKGRHPVAI